MLKLLFMLLFMIYLFFFKKSFWMVQNYFFFLFFLCLLTLNFYSFGNNISYYFFLDLLSYGLILLSIWVSSLMMMASELVFKVKNYLSSYMFLILVLLFFLFLTFSTNNLFMFYLFFESSLIPILLMIMGWGYQSERLQAGLYLLFYTLFMSMPLLMSIFYLWSMNYTTIYFFFWKMSYFNLLIYLSIILAFFVKMPMFLVHLWLPKAHVEAPVAGSMILAGVLLKLGGYGLLRVFNFLMEVGIKLNFFWVSISLVGGSLVSLMCLRQMDLKALIAYSSVAHMGIVLAGLLNFSFWGFCGSYTLMIGHGLCSSGLFCLANMIYERLGSRSLLINSGLLNFLPSLAFWWFLFSSNNMASPPSLNLLGEISLLNSIISWSIYSMVFLSLISFFSAAYSLYMYSFSQHGGFYSAIYSFSMNYIREYLVLMLHWVPLNFLVLKSSLCFLWI